MEKAKEKEKETVKEKEKEKEKEKPQVSDGEDSADNQPLIIPTPK